jgi:hypothetical protein
VSRGDGPETPSFKAVFEDVVGVLNKIGACLTTGFETGTIGSVAGTYIEPGPGTLVGGAGGFLYGCTFELVEDGSGVPGGVPIWGISMHPYLRLQCFW